MKRYSEGFKSRMVKRMAGAEGISAGALEREVGVTRVTLSRWLKEFSKVPSMSKKKSKKRGRRSASEKMRIVVEAAMLSDEDFGTLLRKEGIHETDLNEWRATIEEALKGSNRKKSKNTPEARKIKSLEFELRRKERALAETAALLVLKKKWGAYLEEKDDAIQRRIEL